MGEPCPIAAKAHSHNPALDPLAFLIGEWRTTGKHPKVPNKTLCGRTSFAWHEGGAFLIMRQEIDEPQFPDGVAIIGSDDSGKFSMTYFDERGVSRARSGDALATIARLALTWARRRMPTSAEVIPRVDRTNCNFSATSPGGRDSREPSSTGSRPIPKEALAITAMPAPSATSRTVLPCRSQATAAN